jgi:undecaprenyl-diphosphatase
LEPRTFWEPLDRAELPILEWVERTRAGGAIQDATKAITISGQHGIVWYAIAGAAAVAQPERRGKWIGAAAKVAGIYAATTALKYVARRRRPPIAAVGTPTDLSFPSSHAVTSFAAARLFSDLAPGATAPLYLGAFVVTGSRLHFCVHYPSDLIAGALIGEAAGRALTSPA